MVALFYSLICTHDSGIIHTDYALFEGGIILYQDAGLGHMIKITFFEAFQCLLDLLINLKCPNKSVFNLVPGGLLLVVHVQLHPVARYPCHELGLLPTWRGRKANHEKIYHQISEPLSYPLPQEYKLKCCKEISYL